MRQVHWFRFATWVARWGGVALVAALLAVFLPAPGQAQESQQSPASAASAAS